MDLYQEVSLYVMLCAISYHLQNLRNVENILHGCFSSFLNFANGTKLRKASLYSQVLSFLKQKSYKSSLFECDLGLFFFSPAFDLRTPYLSTTTSVNQSSLSGSKTGASRSSGSAIKSAYG